MMPCFHQRARFVIFNCSEEFSVPLLFSFFLFFLCVQELPPINLPLIFSALKVAPVTEAMGRRRRTKPRPGAALSERRNWILCFSSFGRGKMALLANEDREFDSFDLFTG